MRCNLKRTTGAAGNTAAAPSLLSDLVTALTPSPTERNTWEADGLAVEMLRELLRLHGRHWPGLDDADQVALGATCGERYVRIYAEPTDGFAPTLEVCFTNGGRLIAWRSTCAEPLPMYV